MSAPVLLYDGVCGFCNGAVRTILRYDRRGTLRFASLDSDFARRVIERHPDVKEIDSMVFVEEPEGLEERLSIRSAAGLRLVDYLGGPWKALVVTRLIPAPVLDWLYDRLADIRYRLFGKYDTCPIPPPEVRARFLD